MNHWFLELGSLMDNKTTVVNKYAAVYDVYIGRGSVFGNPFPMSSTNNRFMCIEKYKAYFDEKLEEPDFLAAVMELKGKTLGCFCKPKSCHGDVIAAFLNSIKD